MTLSTDARRICHSLLALQSRYIKALEQESEDGEKEFEIYIELCEELRQKMQTSAKYAKIILENQEFQEACQIPTGMLSIYLYYYYQIMKFNYWIRLPLIVIC